MLKYEAPAEQRTRIVDELFREQGGDERALCDQLYLDWDEVRELDRAGIEIGAHTHSHEILARLEPEEARREIARSKAAARARPGPSRARASLIRSGGAGTTTRPSLEGVRSAGFASASTTHAGTNRAGGPRYELRRVMIDENTRLYRLVAEACGGFDLLRRFGVELGE